MPTLTSFLTTAALLAASTMPRPASAHTWIEEMQMIDSNGSYTGDRGFSRGYMARTDPGFDGESNLWMLPALEARMPDETVRTRVNGSDLLCHPSQRNSNYTNPAYPQLKATPGGYVAMKYLENGHVTLPWTLTVKPVNGGTVLIFGTSKPQDEEKIVDVMQWTKDGSGGNGNGFLMGAMDYDDGECHQINTCWVSGERQIIFPNDIPGQENSQTERWCESDIKIPENVAAGVLTVYWIWDWGTKPGEDCLAPDGRDQYYTNCADFEIVADSGDAAANNAKVAADAGTGPLEQQDPNTRAVKNFASRTAVNSWALTTAAAWADFNNKVAATPSSAQDSSWLAFCQTSILADQSAAAANPTALPPSCPPGSSAPTGANYTSWSASLKNRATNLPADLPAPTTASPAMTAPPATSAPAASSTQAPAPPASSVQAEAPPPSSAPQSAAGSVITVTETQITISTLTTYVATPPASSAPAASAPAPAPPAESPPPPAPPVSDANARGYPTIPIAPNNPSAGMPSGAPSGVTPPYAAHAGPNGLGGEHSAPPRRRHARAFGGMMN